MKKKHETTTKKLLFLSYAYCIYSLRPAEPVYIAPPRRLKRPEKEHLLALLVH